MSATQIEAYPHYQRLVRHLGVRILKRMHAAGCRTMQLADIEQEIAITWTICRDKYEPDKGVAFVSYFVRAVWFNVNRWSKEQIDQAHLAPTSLDDTVGEDDNMERHDVVADPAESIDTVMMRAQSLSRVLRRLSPMAQTFVRLLESPPPELYRQLDHLRARGEYGRQRGLPSQTPHHITAALVFRAMGVKSTERTLIYREIQTALAAVNQV